MERRFSGGEVSTIRQYLSAGLIDEVHLVISPAVLGRGEALLAGLDPLAMGYRTPWARAMHVPLEK